MRHVQVGNVDVFALVDNVIPYPATAVYPKATDLSRFAHYFQPDGGVALNFGSFLLRDGNTLLLVDTGWGPENNGRLLAELAETGIAPADITAVTFTHLHGDHTGWNFDRASGKPLFASATYLVPKADWDHYTSETPQPDSFTRDVQPLQELGRLELISGEHTFSPSLTAVPTPGHTPGHTSVAIASGTERGFILGDVVISPADTEDPQMENSFDWDHEIARETRTKLLERLANDAPLVGASHLPAPGLGHFVRLDNGTSWRPLP